MSKASTACDLGHCDIKRTVIRFAIPCAATMVVNSLYTIVDQIFIGWGVGYLANGATNIIFPLNIIVLAVGLMIGDGGAAFFSISLGRKDNDSASKTAGNAFVLLTGAGILILAISLLCMDTIVHLFGGTQRIYDYAYSYGIIIAIGLPFYLYATGFNALLRADGRPKLATISMTVGAIINVILDPTFIFLFHWGVEGAAWATVIGQIVSALISGWGIFHLKTVPLNKHHFRPDLPLYKRFTRLGLSSGILQISVMIGMIVNNNLLTKFGALSVYGAEIPLTTFGIMIKFDHVMTVCIVGIALGAQTLIGYNLGRGDYQRVRQTVSFTLKLSILASLVFTAVFMLFPQAMLNIFGQEDGLYNEFGVMCFRIYLCLVVGNGIQSAVANFYTSMGKPIHSCVISVLRQIVFRLPVAWALCTLIGVTGALWAGPVADVAAGATALLMLRHQMKQWRQLE